jgi:PAS domain-containing protein
MSRWPIRRKLLSTPVAAATVLGLVPWLVLLLPGRRIAIAITAFGLLVVIAMIARAIADDVARRIAEARAALAAIADPQPPPEGDELDALAAGVHTALYHGHERETDLYRAAEFLRFAQYAGGFGLFDLDLASGQITATPLFFSLIGMKSHGLPFTRHDWLATVHPEDFEPLVRALEGAMEGAGHFQAEYRTLIADGSVRWLAACGEVSTITELEHGRLIGTVTEITARKRLEESHRAKSESLIRAQAAAGIATMDLNFHRRSWICSDNFHEFLGLPETTPLNDLNGRLLRVHPDDVERVRRAPFETSREAPSYCCEYRLLGLAGEERWIAEKADVTHGPNGEILRLAGALIDITDLKRTEAALNSTERRLARTMLGTRDGVWEIDVKADRLWYGPRFEELLGFATGELDRTREGSERLMHPDDVAPARAAFKNHLSLDTPLDIEVRLRHAKGHYEWVRLRGQAERDAAGAPV